MLIKPTVCQIELWLMSPVRQLNSIMYLSDLVLLSLNAMSILAFLVRALDGCNRPLLKSVKKDVIKKSLPTAFKIASHGGMFLIFC